MNAAPFDLQTQELNYRKAQLRVEFLKERIEAATLRAPFDGLVQSVRTRVGELVEEYNTIVVVADPRQQSSSWRCAGSRISTSSYEDKRRWSRSEGSLRPGDSCANH